MVGHIDVTPELIAGTGFLFAPAVISLADTLCAAGCGNNIPEGSSFTTVELKTNFLGSAAVAGGRLRALVALANVLDVT